MYLLKYTFLPVPYRCYVDEMFLLFSSADYTDKVRGYLSSNHINISFFLNEEMVGNLLLNVS